MRTTAAKGIDLLALFCQDSSWTRQAVARELGMSPNAAYDFLQTLVHKGVLEVRGEGREEHRYRLSDSYKGTLETMLGKARREDVLALIRERLREIERSVQVQLEHLASEIREML